MAKKTGLVNEGDIVGGYRVVGQLGAGGMGSVYKGFDESLDRHVAIKVLAPELAMDPLCVARFEREAKTLASMRHPNLMHIYSVGSHMGLHYFAMEHIEGQSLADCLATQKTLPLAHVWGIASQVLAALQKIHQQGIIHRDLKPGNIMLDLDGRAILVDFGLSKDASMTGLTTDGSIMGTPDYMAPEQIEGEPVTPATDLYAMGIILFQMISGEKPFHKRSQILTMRAHCEDPPPSICERVPGLSPLVERLCNKLLAKSPLKRYRDVTALARAMLKVHEVHLLQELAKRATVDRATPTIIDDAPISAITASTQAQSKRSAVRTTSRKKSNRTELTERMQSTTQDSLWRTWGLQLVLGALSMVMLLVILLYVWWPNEPRTADPVTDPVVATGDEVTTTKPPRAYLPPGATQPTPGLIRPPVLLIFKDGREMRGRLDSLGNDVVIRQRGGVKKTFAMSGINEVRFIQGRDGIRDGE